MSTGFITRVIMIGFNKFQVLTQLGALAIGGLAALFASNALRSVSDLNRRMGDNDDDLSALQARIGNLTDTQRALQGNITTVQTTANNAATAAQLMTPATAANRANMQIEDICRNVSYIKCVCWKTQ